MADSTPGQAARERLPLDLETIFPEVGEIQDAALRQRVIAVWQRLWAESAWERLEDLPVSGAIASPQVPHNRAVVQVAMAMATIFRQLHGVSIDTDRLLAAALLQDASKLVE